MPTQSDPEYEARIDRVIATTPPPSGAAAQRIEQWLAANAPAADPPHRWLTEVRPTLGPYHEAAADEPIPQLTTTTVHGATVKPFDPTYRRPAPAPPRVIGPGDFDGRYRRVAPWSHPVHPVELPPSFDPVEQVRLASKRARDTTAKTAEITKRTRIAEITTRAATAEAAKRARIAALEQRDDQAARMRAAGASLRRIADAIGLNTTAGAYHAAKRGRARAELAAQQARSTPVDPAIADRPRRDHEAARLRDASGLPWRDIAERLGYATPSGAHQAAARGRTLLAQAAKQAGDPYRRPPQRRYTRDDIAVGDEIRTQRTSWRKVIRVNRSSVTLAREHSSYRTLPVLYTHITDHRKPGCILHS